MKYILVTLLLVAYSASAQTDEQQVKDVVLSAYVGGIHNGGPIEDIRKGFHPAFNMIVLRDNNVNLVAIEDWIANIEKARAGNESPASKADAKFVSVTVTGTAANVMLELWRDNKRVFTDNLLLYKFNEGWRIVGKTFYRHP